MYDLGSVDDYQDMFEYYMSVEKKNASSSVGANKYHSTIFSYITSMINNIWTEQQEWCSWRGNLKIFEFRERNCFRKYFTSKTIARARTAFDFNGRHVLEDFSISEKVRILHSPFSMPFSMDRFFCFFSIDVKFFPKLQ